MSALSALEVPVRTEPGATAMTKPSPEPGVRHLRVVGEPLRPTAPRAVSAARQPRSSSINSGPREAGSSAPLRLTRRGRLVVAAVLVVGLTAAALLISLAVSGGAQASNHGTSGSGYQGMREIVVQPGQTLWSIASAAEPSADPRSVIQEIITVNGLTGSGISAGQLLYVPR
jgi:hypothetical protein